ncbi:hypothetical protein D3C73_392140 [compost metagenome]
MLQGEIINIIHGILAVMAVVLVLIPSKGAEDSKAEFQFNRVITVLYAFLVGNCPRLLEQGGAVIIIPIMLTVLRIPTRTRIASFNKLAVHKSSIVLDHGTGTVGVRIHEEFVSRKVIMA